MSRIFSADVATAVTARGGTAARGKDGSLRCHLDGREAGDADRQGGMELGGGGWGAGPGSPGRAKALSLLRRTVSDRRWGASCPLSEQDTCPSCSLT